MKFDHTRIAARCPRRLGALILLTGSLSTLADQGGDIRERMDSSIDTISVTATRIERATKEVPSAINVIDGDRIESAQMMNIKDAIQGTPGVLIDSKNGGYDVRLIIRGAGQKANYGVREIMVLRDGVPMTDPDSFSRFDYFDTQDVERIEITKGPGSLYGAGSAGGTLQIISKSVFDTDDNRLKFGLGNQGAQNFNLRAAGDIDDANAIAVTASHRALANEWRRWNEFDTNQLGFKHGLMLGDGTTLESELSYSEADLQLPGSMSEAQFKRFQESGKQKETQDVWKHSGRYSKIWFFNSRLEKEWGELSFRPRLYFNHWSHYHPVTGVINDNQGTNVFGTDLEFSYRHQLFGDSTLVAGVTARVEDTDAAKKYQYRDVTIVPFGPQAGRITATLSDAKGDLMEQQSATNSLFGLYLQESIKPSERWMLDLSLRYDRSHFDIDSNEITSYDYASGKYQPGVGRYRIDKRFDLLSPRLGASYALTPTLSLFGSIARSDQVPSESEIKGNPALDASTATNFEIGMKGRSGRWSFDSSLYYTRVVDEIVPTLVNGETLFRNAGRTSKKGLELIGDYRLTERLTLGGSYAFSDYLYDDFIDAGSDYSGNQMPYVPRHQYSLFVDYRHPAGLKARLQANSWGSYYLDAANSEKYGGYDFVTDLSLGYERGPHSLALNIQNLFDKHYATEVKKDTRGKTYYSAASPLAAMLTYNYAF
ncbi:MAG: TonB-dependent receptor [Gammaproteobacteria bacterium]|nr:TonB-dependent receptor [Gammaproteobacteria bacterium]MCP5418124.1 TonB-dependent receptor [Chromatiaceae bacterium]